MQLRATQSLNLQLPKEKVTGAHNIWVVTYDLGNWSPREWQGSGFRTLGLGAEV